MNRQLLKEAIADAKTVKESAIANAKVALEESLTPHIQNMLSTKIREMEEDDDFDDGYDEDMELHEPMDQDDNLDNPSFSDEEDEEIDLDEVLKEFEEDEDKEEVDEAKKSESDDEGEDEDLEAELEDEDGENEDDEELDLDEMTDDQLKSFIEDIIKEMVDGGELTPGDNFDKGENEGNEDDDEDIDLDLDSDEEDEKGDEEKEEKVDESTYLQENKALKRSLKEHIKTIKTLKESLNEINLLNSKLLYVNKIFKSKNLRESEKLKVLEAFDRTKSTREAKLVYEALKESFGSHKSPIKENFIRRSASDIRGGIKPNHNKEEIIESDPMVARFKKLAGLS